jgi:DNA-directed RNA polymerase beta' subunit
MRELKKRGKASAFKFLTDYCNKAKKKCIYNGGCNAIQPSTYRKIMADKIKNLENVVQIEAEYKADTLKDTAEKIKFILQPSDVLNIFKRISPEDVELLGFDNEESRPEWMICTVVPVAPPAVRPSVREDNNKRAEDHLTSKFCSIIKTVRQLKKAIERDSDVNNINKILGLVQYHVATLVDNEIQNIPPDTLRSGQPLKVIRQRLKGKEGRIRNNIMGKRVDFSGRSVVDVDPNISIDEYGVPERIAMNLTVPETVTKWNKKRLYKFVRNGPNKHPGARQITKVKYDEEGRPNNENIYLKYVDRESIVLEEGDIVERHLMDGDVGQFNRQPSLHRMSMMAHKVKVMKGNTFRLNVYVCKPYNADFDGDEMNTHIPQNIETMIELEQITAVPTQIIKPANSNPIITVVQDSMVGAYLMTQPTNKINKRQLFNLLMTNKKFNGVLPKDKDGYWRGQDLYSMFLPDVSITKGNNLYEDSPIDDHKIVIKNGEYVQGIMDSSVLKNPLLHLIFNSYGPMAARDFLDNNQRVVSRWLEQHGFTLGYGDCSPTEEMNKVSQEKVIEKNKSVNTLLKEVNMGIYKSNLDKKFLKLSMETDIMNELEEAKHDVHKFVRKRITLDNNMYVASTKVSGTKGSESNIGQVMGILGQQVFQGKRIPFSFNKRTLPFFARDDYSAESRGFVKNCFFNGLSPIETFFHQMAGRVGNIDTAIKSVTADTPIIIMENGMTRYVKIGEYIDNKLSENMNQVEKLEEKDQELLKLNNEVFIPTVDEEGNVSWGEMVAVTRHDPGEEIYKISTYGGRSVKVVESKSLIVWNKNENKFEEIPTSELKTGDYLPVTETLKNPPIVVDDLDMKKYLTKEMDNVPERFELDFNNGMFVGIFVGSGNVDKEKIEIRENISFAERWLKSFDIKLRKENERYLVGYSRIFSNFLNNFVGEGENKYIPDVSFGSNEGFIKGILTGYFSSNGVITKNSINSLSKSFRLIEGVNMLCSRLGIFGKIRKIGKNNIVPSYKLEIKGQWVKEFSKKIDLMDDKMNMELRNIRLSNQSFKVVNDVVLDKVVSIEKLDVQDYLKVYDVTVPDTLNFGLANGLQVRDTAESGYMQRRLIKALEDLMIKYGGTVRNALNNIVQFTYGDDGIDPIKLEQQKMEIMKLNDEEMERNFKISDGDMKNLKTIMTKDAYQEISKNGREIFDNEFEMLMNFRNLARTEYFTKINIMDNTVFSAINFYGIVNSAKDRFKIQLNMKTDLTPDFIKKGIEDVLEKMKNYLPVVALNMFKILIFSHLSYKKAIIYHRLNKTVFTFILDTIKERYMSSLVHPGEMVGIIAAQSIGEPLTQMSVPSETKIIVEENGEVDKTEIGMLIDDLIKEKRGVLEVDDTGAHSILTLDKEIKILSVSKEEKNEWRTISKVSRHPVNGGLMKITTRSGKETRATLSHSFLKREEDGIEPVLGSDLKIGDRVPVAKQIPVINGAKEEFNGYKLTKEFGYLCGDYLANGNLIRGSLKVKLNERLYHLIGQQTGLEMKEKNGYYYFEDKDFSKMMKNTFGKISGEKRVPGFVFGSNLNFISGLISGYLEGDGSIDKDKNFVRISSASSELLNDMCLLLSYFGIFGMTSYDKKRGKSFYLSVSKKYAKLFVDKIGFYNQDNLKIAQDIINYNQRENPHDVAEYVDKIPKVGELIADTGRLLGIKGNSRIYGRWRHKESIGRRTLEKYLETFKSYGENVEVQPKIKLLEQAVNSDVVWDEIVKIDYYDGNNEYVYDFTVPGTESFMVDTGILVHNTLNTFHMAGQGASAIVTTQGVPRIKEIINVAKTIKTPTMSIFLKEEYNQDIEKAKQVLSQIEFTKMQDIVDKTMILYEKNGDTTKFSEDIEYIKTFQDFADIIGLQQCPVDQLSNWVLRIIFNKEKMMNKKIYLKDLQDVIMKKMEEDIQCVFTDDNAKELVLRIKVREDKVKEDNMDKDYVDFLKDLEKILMGITIRGIPNVEKVEPTMKKRLDYYPDGSYKQNTEWYLATNGVNLVDVLMIEEVDSCKTISNDIHEIYEIFGIEAARNILINELFEKLLEGGSEVNYRHISLLIDLMTHKGTIMPIERHGINRSSERGAIAKATFEESTEILVKASTFAEVDKMGGVSANVMFGQFPQVGTNAFDVLFDETKFMKEVENLEEEEILDEDDLTKEIEKDIEELDENQGLNDAFDFDLDITKNPETKLVPHTIPSGGFQMKTEKKKLKIKKK